MIDCRVISVKLTRTNTLVMAASPSALCVFRLSLCVSLAEGRDLAKFRSGQKVFPVVICVDM